MNRRKIFGWLAGLLGAGAASAQDRLPLSVTAKDLKCEGLVDGKTAEVDCFQIGWQHGKAKNNQCPVCGTMAEPYKDPYHLSFQNSIRCKKCNAGFWQDVKE